jgi:N-acetylglucosamine kinase-like BadF-type ATPase
MTAGSDQVVLGVDGGNSKTDVLLLAADGRTLGQVRGPTVSHQAVGMTAAMERLASLVDEVRGVAGLAGGVRIASAVLALAGADYPSDVRRLDAAVAPLGLADRVAVINDTWAGLRAGTDRGWGIVLICGAGTNGAGLAPDGRRWRFAAVGEISGDLGGGGDIGLLGWRAAIRGWDGRGPRTTLSDVLSRHLGFRRPDAVTRALYEGRLHVEWRTLAPLVFAEAMAGDPVARGIIDDQADELAGMARVIARHIHVTRRDPDVVLAGAVFQTTDGTFFERLERGIRTAIPQARIVHRDVPPVVGAAHLALDALRAESRSDGA